MALREKHFFHKDIRVIVVRSANQATVTVTESLRFRSQPENSHDLMNLHLIEQKEKVG